MANAAAPLGALALDALGDPTRRRTLELLRGGERTVSEITADLPVTQSAVSQHLKVLRDAGLVRVRAEGNRRLYRVDLDGLGEIRAYVDRFWDDVLGAYAGFVEAHVAATADAQPAADAPRRPPRKRATR